jgi:hypothetical protein
MSVEISLDSVVVGVVGRPQGDSRELESSKKGAGISKLAILFVFDYKENGFAADAPVNPSNGVKCFQGLCRAKCYLKPQIKGRQCRVSSIMDAV